MVDKNKNNSMKKIVIICLSQICISISCSKKVNYYEGYIYNKQKKPIKGLMIFEKLDKEKFVYTSNQGFFKLKKNEQSINDLMIAKEGKIVDSIQTVRTSGGEKINYYFIEGRKDTLFIDIKDL
jgi:hypothetical protein